MLLCDIMSKCFSLSMNVDDIYSKKKNEYVINKFINGNTTTHIVIDFNVPSTSSAWDICPGAKLWCRGHAVWTVTCPLQLPLSFRLMHLSCVEERESTVA